MSKILKVRNVNHALPEALNWLRVAGVTERSRNGLVLVAPGPVLTQYAYPLERVLFSPTRDANPFFHFFEALWMLGGRNDVAYVGHFAKNMLNYSDDGDVLHGAYGFRWREWFGFDQLSVLVSHLRQQPDSRRAVLSMWSPCGDLVSSEGAGGLSMKDVPCNTQCYFDLRDDVLNMSVMCRSNDLVWGAYGANAVHFAFLMEYLAMRVGRPVGRMYQYSHNLHLYTDKFDEAWRERERHGPIEDRYSDDLATPFPLLSEHGEDVEAWEHDLRNFMASRRPERVQYYCAFFNHVVLPLARAHEAYRNNDFSAARNHVEECEASDWKHACAEWLTRREAGRKS